MRCNALDLHSLWRFFSTQILKPRRCEQTCNCDYESNSLEDVQMELSLLVLPVITLSSPRVIGVCIYRTNNLNPYSIIHR